MDRRDSGKIWLEIPSFGLVAVADADGVFCGVGGKAKTLMLPSSKMLISPV